MRDIIVTFMLIGPLPYVLVHPWAGVLLWVFIGVMNPHKLAWGFAQGLPFALLAAAATFVGLVFTKDRKQFPLNALTITLILFVLWMCLTHAVGLQPEYGMSMFVRTLKILLMTFVAIYVINTRRHLDLLIWTLVLSLAYYGVKGGLFTILSGGSYRVWGPQGSFIEDNNSLALATIMAVPLAYYLLEQSTKRWMKWAIGTGALLCSVSAIGSQSRGALLAIAAMAVLLWARSKRKVAMGGVLFLVAPAILVFMPDTWWDRMNTIKTYDQDSSAMGRINAWWTAYYVARDRITGAGFFAAHPDVFAKYAPDPTNPLAAHSIYFQVLGEHGFPGLFLFLLAWFLTWRYASWIRARTKNVAELHWAFTLASMIQVSIFAFAVGGAFLSLSYFDLPYYELVAVVVMRELVKTRLAEMAPKRPAYGYSGMPLDGGVAAEPATQGVAATAASNLHHRTARRPTG